MVRCWVQDGRAKVAIRRVIKMGHKEPVTCLSGALRCRGAAEENAHLNDCDWRGATGRMGEQRFQARRHRRKPQSLKGTAKVALCDRINQTDFCLGERDAPVRHRSWPDQVGACDAYLGREPYRGAASVARGDLYFVPVQK